MSGRLKWSTAALCAAIFFFLGSNLTLLSGNSKRPAGARGSVLGAWFGAQRAGAADDAFKGAGDATAEWPRQRLRRAVDDMPRTLCRKRYPGGFILSADQEVFLHAQRWFLVVTLRNNEELLPHMLDELTILVDRLGVTNVFVSIFENNSKDKTPHFLALFKLMLEVAGVQHEIITTHTIAEAQSAASGSARRLVAGEHGVHRSPRTLTDAGEQVQVLGVTVSGARALNAAPEADVDNHVADGFNLTDTAIGPDTKWKGNRIEFLAKVRNTSIRPLFQLKEKYDKVIFMNDAYFCAEDVLRLAVQTAGGAVGGERPSGTSREPQVPAGWVDSGAEADVMCGLDFDSTEHYPLGFYDTWVDRDIAGEPFKKSAPFVQRPDDVALLRSGMPFPVYCCWNGLLVANAEPFYEGVRFRRSTTGECAASECSLFCKDFWHANKRKFAIDPHVRVAYERDTYEKLHAAPWMDTGAAELARRVEWPVHVPWPPYPPMRVYCCGLEGSGRDADAGCRHEETKLPD